jgi:hypothetical protein
VADLEFVPSAAEQFAKLSRDLKVFGAVELKKELTVGIREAAQPLIAAAKASAEATLPSTGGRGVRSFNRATGAKQKKLKTKGFANRGGKSTRVESLASRVANANFTISVKTGPNPGVTITGKGKSGKPINLMALDYGRVRHPVYGHWRADVPAQTVNPEWWSKPMEAAIPGIEVAVQACVSRVAEKFNTGSY